MANQLTKDLEILFGQYIEGFDAACVLSMEVKKFSPDQQAMQRAGDVVYRPQDYHTAITSGLDISAATPTDVVQRMVPSVYKTPNNVLYQLDAKEMRDQDTMTDYGKAAGMRLAAQIDSDLYSTIALRAANVVKKVGTIAWDDFAQLEAIMLAKGMPLGVARKAILNPFDYKDIAKDLGNRQYTQGAPMNAYEKSQVPGIAGFDTFRSDNLYNLAAIGTVSGTTVNGNQSFTPSAMTGDLPTDNRQMTLTVQGANVANIKAGDTFTIANVNSVHNVTKDDTGNLQTFRVLSVAGGGTSLTITPAIVVTGPYQNVTTQAANSAALTFVNTVTKPVNVAWVDGAVELMAGRLAFPSNQGAQVMTAVSKNGIPLIMSYQFDHLKARTTCRFTALYGTTVLQPELCGIVLANQT